jgi:hypothetical protein
MWLAWINLSVGSEDGSKLTKYIKQQMWLKYTGIGACGCKRRQGPYRVCVLEITLGFWERQIEEEAISEMETV